MAGRDPPISFRSRLVSLSPMQVAPLRVVPVDHEGRELESMVAEELHSP